MAKEQGKSFATLEDRPEIYPDLKWIWEAFIYLDKRRPHGFNGPLAIPPSEILAYCTLAAVRNQDSREDLLRFLSVLDNQLLEHHEQQGKAATAKPKGKPPTRF